MVVSVIDVAPPRVADPIAEDMADRGLVTVERRRPSRREVSPELIPLLRAPFAADSQNERGPAQVGSAVDLSVLDDGGDPARSILLGMLLLLPFWGVAIGIIVWMWG